MGDVAAQVARRIISSWWYRFRRAIEDTPAALMVISQSPCVRSCASLSLELISDRPAWSNTKQTAFESNDVTLKAYEYDHREQLAKSPPRLFLVTDLLQHKSYDSLPTYSLILQGTGLQWTGGSQTLLAAQPDSELTLQGHLDSLRVYSLIFANIQSRS